MLRLGDSVSREGFIPPDAADVAVATVRRMKMLAEAAAATEIVACDQCHPPGRQRRRARRPHRGETGVRST